MNSFLQTIALYVLVMLISGLFSMLNIWLLDTVLYKKPVFKIGVSFWIWRNLSGGKTPFYWSPKLDRFQAPIAPSADAWWGWKLRVWTAAQDYLVSIGELTYTPTLTEKF